ncbi:MAG: hypothetical protein ACFFDC_12305 [Promethearchaeota archaeon]
MTYLIARKLSIRIFWRSFVTAEEESRRIILRKGRMESKLHIILKILAYCYFWDRNLVIEPFTRVNRFRPDLIAWTKSEIPTEEKPIPDLWIECKQVKLKKLERLSRILPFTQIIWINSKQSLTRTLKNLHSRRRKKDFPSNVQLIGISTSKDSWESLIESINEKKPQWRINRHSKELLVIDVTGTEINPIPLDFQILLESKHKFSEKTMGG